MLPFLTVPAPTLRDAVAYAAFLIFAAAIFLRSSVVQINPLLYLFGYRVLEVVDSNASAPTLSRVGVLTLVKYRHRTEIENIFRDSKHGAALRHLPSGYIEVNTV